MTKLAIHAGVLIAPPAEHGPGLCDEVPDATVLIDGPRIEAVGRDLHVPAKTRRIDAREKICVPGFIDMHVHGAGGHDLMEGTPEALTAVSTTLARFGTTSFFPTTVTASVPSTLKALERISTWVGGAPASLNDAGPAAQPLGIHME